MPYGNFMYRFALLFMYNGSIRVLTPIIFFILLIALRRELLRSSRSFSTHTALYDNSEDGSNSGAGDAAPLFGVVGSGAAAAASGGVDDDDVSTKSAARVRRLTYAVYFVGFSGLLVANVNEFNLSLGAYSPIGYVVLFLANALSSVAAVAATALYVRNAWHDEHFALYKNQGY